MKDLEEVTVDTICYFDNKNIKEVIACEYKEFLVPHVGEEISIYEQKCIPNITFFKETCTLQSHRGS